MIAYIFVLMEGLFHHVGRPAPMWQQSGILLFCSCHGIAGLFVDEL